MCMQISHLRVCFSGNLLVTEVVQEQALQIGILELDHPTWPDGNEDLSLGTVGVHTHLA